MKENILCTMEFKNKMIPLFFQALETERVISVNIENLKRISDDYKLSMKIISNKEKIETENCMFVDVFVSSEESLDISEIREINEMLGIYFKGVLEIISEVEEFDRMCFLENKKSLIDSKLSELKEHFDYLLLNYEENLDKLKSAKKEIDFLTKEKVGL